MAISMFNNNPLDPFGTNTLMSDIANTNQQVGLMNIPEQPSQQEQDFKRKQFGNMLLSFADVLKGRDPSAGVMQRTAMLDAQRKEAEEKAKIEKFLATPQGAPYRTMYTLAGPKGVISAFASNRGQASNERFGVYNKDTKQLIGSVLKSDSVKISELENTPGVVVGQLRSPTVTGNRTGSALQVVDENNNFVRNITMQDFTQNGLQPGEKLTNLPTGTAPADSGDTTDFDPVKTKYLATENIILQTSELAKQFYENPNSALAVGTTSQFVDSIIQNIDAGSKILSSAKDTKAYKFIQSNNKSIEGNDFGDRIKKASQSSGVAESRIRDLGYLFAAARGQEGRGLSDKDFENALKIVSGGVGAEGRIKVLEDVANRIKGEFERSVEFDLNMSEDENYTNKLNKLKPLPMFVNPIVTTSPSSSEVDALVKQYAD
tara:strand:+ start:188 stop:1483 length:1296 start_codon:yes stop_codon:yes gene_type:complete